MYGPICCPCGALARGGAAQLEEADVRGVGEHGAVGGVGRRPAQVGECVGEKVQAQLGGSLEDRAHERMVGGGEQRRAGLTVDRMEVSAHPHPQHARLIEHYHWTGGRQG